MVSTFCHRAQSACVVVTAVNENPLPIGRPLIRHGISWIRGRRIHRFAPIPGKDAIGRARRDDRSTSRTWRPAMEEPIYVRRIRQLSFGSMLGNPTGDA